jgi:hypothetical protein
VTSPGGHPPQDAPGPDPRTGRGGVLSDVRAVRRAFARVVAADLRLAQRELAVAGQAVLRGAALMALALCLLLSGLIALVAASILGLVAAGLSPALAALFSALVFATAAVLAAVLALRLVTFRRLWPSRTIAAVSRLPGSFAAAHPPRETAHA